jgi:hypothetical protein
MTEAEVRELVRTEGLRGMYKGLVPALPLTCHAALHWTIFERFKQLVAQWHGDPNRPVVRVVVCACACACVRVRVRVRVPLTHMRVDEQNVAETFLTASSSKVVAAALTYPLHVMKTCMQVSSLTPARTTHARLTTILAQSQRGLSVIPLREVVANIYRYAVLCCVRVRCVVCAVVRVLMCEYAQGEWSARVLQRIHAPLAAHRPQLDRHALLHRTPLAGRPPVASLPMTPPHHLQMKKMKDER